MGTEIEQFVEKVIAENKTVIFSKSYCPYCIRVKEALNNAGFLKSSSFVIELDKDTRGPSIQQYLAHRTNQTTVPNVFVDGKHIGGCDKTLAALSSGALRI